MKKWMATFAAVAVVCAVAPQAEANETIVQDEGVYEINIDAQGKQYAVLKNMGYSTMYEEGKTVVIPSHIKGVPVVEIATGAAKNPNFDESVFLNISHLVLPETIKRIGKEAFVDSGIVSIQLPEGLEVIEDRAFYNSGIQKLVIPNSVTKLGQEIIKGTTTTLHVQLPAKWNHVAQKRHDHLFYEEFTHNGVREVRILGYDPKKSIKSIAIPDTINGMNVTEIADDAFSIPRSIVYTDVSIPYNVTFPKTIRKVGDRAFKGMHQNAVTINDYPNLQFIGEEAFHYNRITNTKPFVVTEQMEIGQGAFAGNQLTAVIVEEGVTHVAHNVFDSNQLTTITLPSTLTTIGNNAFSSNALTTVQLGNDVKTIGDRAFADNQLVTIGLQNVTHIGRRAFYQNALTNVTLPNMLASIGEEAFAYNSLKNIRIPAVTYFGERAFSSNALTEVELTEGLSDIPAGAFEGNQLTEIDWPSSVRTVGDDAFAYNRFETVVIPANTAFGNNVFKVIFTTIDKVVFEEGATHVPNGVFKGKQLESFTLPKTITHIGDYAFSGTGLHNITLHEGIEEIGDSAFSNNALTEITIPSTVNVIGNEAFSENQLATVTMPTYIEHIGDNAFRKNVLTTAHVPSTKSIGDGIYTENAITNVTFAEGITTIPAGILSNQALTNVTIPETVTTIGQSAFSGNQLTSITLPSKLTHIEEAGFAGNRLTNVIIPETVTTIGKSAFAGNLLTNIALPTTLTHIEEGVLYNNRLTNVTIPNTVTTIGQYAFANNNLTNVTFPETLERIEYSAFEQNNLTEVTIPKRLKELPLSVFAKNPLTTVTLQGSDTTINAVSDVFNFVNDVDEAFKGLYTNTALTVPYENMYQPNDKPQTLYVAWHKEAKFKDIEGHWAQGAIENFTTKGYINGYPDGTFKPGAPIQRKHVARILNDVFQFEATQTVADFTDVPKSHAYYAAISAVQQAGIFSGDGGKFQPEANLTRGQLAKVLVLAAGFTPGGKSTFKDTPASYWGTPYIATLADLAIVKGTDGFFNPHKPITRAQFVSMTSLALEEMERRANN